MTIQTAKLSQLRLSPFNVRKVKPVQIDQLAADMLAHGQLQNLIGYAEGKHLYVAAGGRRYRALKKLEKAKAIPSSHPVSIDVRDKAEAIELSLAENVQREDMHVADAVIAYGDLHRDGHSAEDIVGRFGVALSYVTKVLRLSALAPVALALLAKDKIGMDAAQALTLTDDHDRQIEALHRCGNNAHGIRRMLTETKVGTGHALFRFVGGDAYAAAGGTITRDLFAKEGDGYADDLALVQRLAGERLDAVAESYRAEGWSEVRAAFDRPDDYYSASTLYPSGQRPEAEAEQAERAALHEARAVRQAEIGDANQWSDRVLNALAAKEQALDERLQLFSDEQKAEGAMILFIGPDGGVEAKPVRVKRAKAKAEGERAASPDYSGPVIEALTRIKTLAVQEAVAADPALALDILLDGLAGQIVHGEGNYMSPLALRLDGFASKVPDDLIADTQIARVEEIAATDFAGLPDHERFAAIRAMETQAKHRLLALLVAGQIDGGQSSGSRRDTRHHRFERIALAAGLDMTQKWQLSAAFFARLRRPVILSIMTEALGQAVADNCAKMKKPDLAIAAAERLADSNWLPPALRAIAPPAEAPRPRFRTNADWEADNGPDDDGMDDEGFGDDLDQRRPDDDDGNDPAPLDDDRFDEEVETSPADADERHDSEALETADA